MLSVADTGKPWLWSIDKVFWNWRISLSNDIVLFNNGKSRQKNTISRTQLIFFFCSDFSVIKNQFFCLRQLDTSRFVENRTMRNVVLFIYNSYHVNSLKSLTFKQFKSQITSLLYIYLYASRGVRGFSGRLRESRFTVLFSFVQLFCSQHLFCRSMYVPNRSDSPRSTRSAPWGVWSSAPTRGLYSSSSPRSVRSGPHQIMRHARRSSSVDSQSSNDSRSCRK